MRRHAKLSVWILLLENKFNRARGWEELSDGIFRLKGFQTFLEIATTSLRNNSRIIHEEVSLVMTDKQLEQFQALLTGVIILEP